MRGKDYEHGFGIDLDTKEKSTVKFFVKRMMFQGQIIQKYETKHGWHFRVKTNKKLTWLMYIYLRDHCGDDSRRIVKDVIRMKQGLSYDTLFMTKRSGWKIHA